MNNLSKKTMALIFLATTGLVLAVVYTTQLLSGSGIEITHINHFN